MGELPTRTGPIAEEVVERPADNVGDGTHCRRLRLLPEHPREFVVQGLGLVLGNLAGRLRCPDRFSARRYGYHVFIEKGPIRSRHHYDIWRRLVNIVPRQGDQQCVNVAVGQSVPGGKIGYESVGLLGATAVEEKAKLVR
jgi:hypothetical protein